MMYLIGWDESDKPAYCGLVVARKEKGKITVLFSKTGTYKELEPVKNRFETYANIAKALREIRS